MFFDDRLATVLRQRALSEAGARTQFRQLLDILGNRKFAPQDDRSSSLLAAAWLRMDALAQELAPTDRAAMIRETGWRFRSPDLAAHLADHEPEVASAALNRAHLSADDWETLIPRLPIRARGFLRLRRDLPLDTEALLERLGVQDRGLPSPVRTKPAENEEITAKQVDPVESKAAEPSSEPLGGKIPAPQHMDKTGETEPDQTEPEQTEPEQVEPNPTDQDQSDQDKIGQDKMKQGSAKSADVAAPFAFKVPPTPPIPAEIFDEAESGRSEISALVERIAQFRKTRDLTPVDAERSPKLPLGLDEGGNSARRISAFGFSADATGRIEWAETKAAAMVIGARLTRPPVLGRHADKTGLERAFHRRLPVTKANFRLDGAPSIAGDWVVDAQPSFTDEGNFTGYIGRFRRPAGDDPDAPGPAAREADQIRQLLHELRTPITAVQGYAEVIQQQLFGSAPHDYRALAASIAADAARILSGFEELDRLAKLETGTIAMEPGEADLSALAHATNNQLGQVLGSRMAGIDFAEEPAGPIYIALDNEDAEGLLWRLLATLGGNCASGEMLQASLETGPSQAFLKCELPSQLMAEDDVFAAEAKPVGASINAGLFGAGFALRLARAEANAAGGSLNVSDDAVTLALPLLTAKQALPSQTERSGEGNAA